MVVVLSLETFRIRLEGGSERSDHAVGAPFITGGLKEMTFTDPF